MKQNRFLLMAIILLLLPLYIITFLYFPFAFETIRYLFVLPPLIGAVVCMIFSYISEDE